MTPWILASPWILVFALILYQYRTARPQLRSFEPRRAGPLLSVIIPARNEAVNIADCLASILATLYSPVEVIVVDDRSTDTTASEVERVAKSAAAGGRVRLVRGAELPEGWFGKPWALVQGYRAARGEVLLFTDADTRHHPELLPRAIRALEPERGSGAGLVSVLPRQELGSFAERLIQPHVFVALASRVGSLERINRTRVSWNAIANGQFILTTRAAYEAAGTHQAVKQYVAEDLMIAQTYVARGLRLFLVHAREFMRTRMYRSLAEIVEGWSKNLALGAPLMLPPVPALRRALPFLMPLPALLWIAPPALWAATHSLAAAIATVASLATWLLVCREEGAPLGYAFLYPAGALAVALIMARSAFRGSRKVVWRGRVYRVPKGPA